MRTGLSTVLVALLGLSSTAAAQSDADVECVPAAILSGEDVVVSELRKQLQILGVASSADPRCSVVTAEVVLEDEGYSVVVTEPSGRSARRTLGDIRIAATWIDSWLRTDLGASLLATRSLPLAASAPVVVRRDSPKSTHAEPTRYQIGLAYETSSNATKWQSLRVDACLTWGAVCVGLQGRFAQADPIEMNDGLSLATQWDADGLALVSVPLQLGATTIEPHAAIGVSAVSTKRSPTDGPDSEFLFDSTPSSRLSVGMRAEAGISAVVSLAEFVRLRLGASIDTRVFGAGELSKQEPGPADPDCLDGETPCPLPPAFVSLPGDPTSLWRLSIGLRVEL